MTFDQTKKALILGFLAGFIWNLFGEASMIIYQIMVARLPTIDAIVQQNSWIQPLRDLVGLIMVFGYVFIIIKICQRLYQPRQCHGRCCHLRQVDVRGQRHGNVVVGVHEK